MKRRLFSLVATILFVPLTALAQGFIRPTLRAPMSGLNMPPDGYLELKVTSQLAPLEARNNRVGASWYEFGPRLELVAVSIGIQTGQPTDPPVEYPIAVYDVQSHQDIGGTGVQLGRAQYIMLGQGAPAPTLTIKVRAIPRNLAREFRQAVDAFNGILTGGAAGLMPIAPQVTAATKLLTSFLGPFVSDHPEWFSTRDIGLTTGTLSVLPLDGSVVVIFLKPSKNDAAVPDYSDLMPCIGAQTDICLRATKQPYTEMPYIMLSATALPYRPMEVVGVRPLSCASTAAEVDQFADIVHRTTLTRDQRTLEERLIERFRLALGVRDGALKTDEGAANTAYRWAQRDAGTQTIHLWNGYGQTLAENYDQCFDTEVTATGIDAVRRWGIFRDAFATSMTWHSTLQSTDRRAQLESFLDVLSRPMRALNLASGPAYNMLRDEQQVMEKELVRGDLANAQDVARLEDVTQLQNLRSQMEQRRNETACGRCHDVLTTAIAQADTRIASIQKATATALAVIADAAAAKAALSEVRQTARQVVDVAKALQTDSSASIKKLSQEITAANQALVDRAPKASELQTRIDSLKTSVAEAKKVVEAKPN